MEANAQLAVGVPLVAERVLHFGLAAICSVGEVVGAHGDGNIASDINLVVFKNHVRPSFSTVDGKASILRIAVLDSFVPNKVGHGVSRCRSKWRFGCLSGLEEHVRVAIAIELASSFGSSCDVVSSVQVGLGDTFDGAGPCCLHSLHFRFGNLRGWSRGRQTVRH